MNNLYQTYFVGVRWVELALAFGLAVLGDLQLTVQGGGQVNQQTVLKSVGIGAGVAWAYLRMPKDGKPAPPVVVDGLPPGVDETGPAHDVEPSAVERAVTAVLPPAVVAMAPDLPGNIVKEMGRVLKRGIRL